ncbi:MAG TPA: sigma 54-interacting transcriptional regulator, partial [Thermodesulfobacteriota bacterium]|nr:sigma 54-interacting transcriptional regulator [Thermodesulfobacteriota bacterium]
MNSHDISSFLGKTKIFSSLGEQDLKSLAGLLQTTESPAGEIVIHQGDFGDSVYFICQGEVDIFVVNQEGAENTIGHLKEGDFFGEMALLTGSPRAASVRVTHGALFFVLHKNDFDAFLKEHPHLAILFSRILAERIQTTNLKYLHQVSQGEQLKKLLSRGEEQHLTRLIGKTKQFQAIEKKIDEMAENDEPLIIVGPSGAATDDVARLIHLKSRRPDRPFMIVDLAGGDEWRISLNRIKSSVNNAVDEAQLFEEYQISTLFGHERGAITGTEVSRLGYIELADGGTIVLKNIDRLSPGTRERLLLYFLEKGFYRLGGKERTIANTRIIATLNTDQNGEDVRKSLRGRVPDFLWNSRIDLPPLAMRRRDIPMIAESFLEKHALLSGKPIKSISPQALNILVRYSWPGNDRELESVIERGVLVCDGDSLLDEHIFLGLIPFSEKGRLNLLRLESIRSLFASRKIRLAFQVILVPLLLNIALISLLGIRVGEGYLGNSFFWCFMLPYLLLSYVVLGRVYCGICPISGLTRVFRKLGSRNLPAPKVFGRLGVAVAAFFALVFLWFETAFAIREITYITAAFIAFLASTAILLNFIFKEEVWCRHLCPMGFLGGVFSCLAPVELRANNNVCTSQCKTTYCYKGDGKNAGCPMGLFPVSITSNQFCKMCGTCVRNCQYKSIHLDLRWPGAEIWENKEPNMVTSVAILALLGAVYPLILHHNHKIPGDSWFPFTLWFVSSVAFFLALFIGASFAKGRKSFRNIVSSYGFVYL